MSEIKLDVNLRIVPGQTPEVFITGDKPYVNTVFHLPADVIGGNVSGAYECIFRPKAPAPAAPATTADQGDQGQAESDKASAKK